MGEQESIVFEQNKEDSAKKQKNNILAHEEKQFLKSVTRESRKEKR